MNLLLDVGNSRIKTAVTGGNGLHELKPFAYDLSSCESLLSNLIYDLETPHKVLVANVGGEAIADRITACILRQWRRKPMFVQVTREWSGLVNGYTDISQLGVDRWLGLLAAWVRYRRFVCVVSCGTAVTIDGATGDGRHLGGVIIPGLELMQRSLNQATKGINASRASDPSSHGAPYPMTPSPTSSTETSNVPPPRSQTRMVSLPFLSRPYARDAAVGSLMIRGTVRPAISPAFLVAVR